MFAKNFVAAVAAVALSVTPAIASPAKNAAAARQVAPAAEKVEGSQLGGYRGGILVPLGVIVVVVLIAVFAFKGKKKKARPSP
jgi:hypothetical protein